ncbi:MAG: CsgG/HfaB family protein, partial [Aquificota bacterium]|nr:CsgG/HfaB family protein [Aquificota bacterium]
MRSFKILLSLSGFFLLLISCGPTAQQAKTTEGEYAKEVRAREPELPRCDRPLGTIVARNFKCKAASCVGNRLVFGPSYTIQLSPQILGEGLSDMLVTALVQTGCFRVLERETLQEIKEELELLGAQPKQTLKGADFLITGAITALEMKASGVGGGGVVIPLPFLGGAGVKAQKQKAHIALDLRIVRV